MTAPLLALKVDLVCVLQAGRRGVCWQQGSQKIHSSMSSSLKLALRAYFLFGWTRVSDFS